jgi:putative effector of murein hydrolase/putative effector of murein hydrolase LrgA (UPF0299 family)
MDRVVPFRFPGPVLGTIIIFSLLLLLDWLSTRFPGPKKQRHPEEASDATAEQGKAVDINDEDDDGPQRKRFLDPALDILSPPCEFLLRNMTLLFTPAFILIPARESIPGREIGLVAAWFLATQILGYVLPVGVCRLAMAPWRDLLRGRRGTAGDKTKDPAGDTKGSDGEKDLPLDLEKQDTQGTLSEVPTKLVSSSSSPPATAQSTPKPAHVVLPAVPQRKPSRKDERPTLASIPRGSHHPLRSASGQSASHDEDGLRRYIEEVETERARQQGEPFASQETSYDALRRSRSHSRGPPHLRLGHRSLSADPAHPERHVHRHRAHRSTHADDPQAVVAPPSVVTRSVTFDFGAGPRIHRGRRARAQPNSAPLVVDTPGANASGLGPLALQQLQVSSPSRLSFTGSSSGRRASPRPSTAEGIIHPFGIGRHRPQSRPSTAEGSDPPAWPSSPVAADDLWPAIAEHRRMSRVAEGQDKEDDDVDQIGIEIPAAHQPLTVATKRKEDERNEALEETATQNDSPTEVATSGKLSPTKEVHEEDATRAPSIASSASSEPDAVERLSAHMAHWLTPFLYTVIGLFAGLPLWFVANESLLLFLCINVLTFWISIHIVPAKIRRFLHPIIATSIATCLLVWALGAMKGMGIKEVLNDHYSREAKYDVLWDPFFTGGQGGEGGEEGTISRSGPGAADVLSSLLDAGIVALFIPLYRYRFDLQSQGFKMLLATIPSVAFSLFFCPAIAGLIGLDQSRALAFSARFLSTPLAIELIETLQGDESLTVILVVLTGILAALLKEPFFKLMRVDMDRDWFIVGVTFGCTSGAIGASSLIAKPRVMATASLGFILFGAVSLIMVAIPPIVAAVRSVAA